jgi:hypothetical protein
MGLADDLSAKPAFECPYVRVRHDFSCGVG